MTADRSAVVPRLGADTEIVIAPQGEVVLRSRGQFAVIEDFAPGDVQFVINEVDGTRTIGEIMESLSSRYGEGAILNVLDALHELSVPATPDPAFEAAFAPAHPTPVAASVLVVGNGRLSSSIAESLRRRFAAVRHCDARAFASCRDERFRRARDTRILLRHSETENDLQDGRAAQDVERLTRQCTEVQLVVCALEGTFFRGVLDVNAACIGAGVPAIFVTVDFDAVHVGPSYLPGLSACFECGDASVPVTIRDCFELFSTYSVSEDMPLDPLLECIGGEAQALTSGALRPRLITTLASFPKYSALAGPTCVTPVLPSDAGGCSCRTATSAGLPPQLQLHGDIALVNSQADQPRVSAGFEDVPDPYRTVGVIGGGTAGYFAALALKAKLPHLDVTLVESSQIPIIGVGESTTPQILHFLHGDLGFDLYDFYCRVRPTWKMGIKFFWGEPGDYYFNEPFQPPRYAEALHYDGTMNTSSFASRLMSRETGPMLETSNGPVFLLKHLAPTSRQWYA